MGACISYGIDALKRNPAYAILGFLVVVLGGSFSMGICQGPLMVGYFRGFLKEDRGEKAEIGDIFKGFDDFVPALVASLVAGIVISIGIMLCVVPGLLIMPIGVVSLYLVAIGEKDGLAAVKRAFEFVKPNLLMGMVTLIVLGLISSVGAIACGVGMLATGPIAVAGGLKLSQQLTGASG